jgi:hypothetical protein
MIPQLYIPYMLLSSKYQTSSTLKDRSRPINRGIQISRRWDDETSNPKWRKHQISMRSRRIINLTNLEMGRQVSKSLLQQLIPSLRPWSQEWNHRESKFPTIINSWKGRGLDGRLFEGYYMMQNAN